MSYTSIAPMESLLDALRYRLADLHIQTDNPDTRSGVYIADLVSNNEHLVLQWQEGRGFGVATATDSFYGEGPEFVSSDEDSVLNFLLQRLTPRPRYSAREELETMVGYSQPNEQKNTPALSLVVLRSTDLERAEHFYAAIGLRFVRHSHGNGPEHLASEGPGPVFEIYPKSNSVATTRGVRIGFNVLSVDSTLTAALRAGGTLKYSPKTSPWGLRAVVTDPDGHVVELVERSALESAPRA